MERLVHRNSSLYQLVPMESKFERHEELYENSPRLRSNHLKGVLTSG